MPNLTVLFIGAHQDDETLIMGGGLLNHLSDLTNKVYYACITDGRSSGLNGVPPNNYMGLTSDQFVAERNNEQASALSRMGLIWGNQLEAAGGRMLDNSLNTDPNRKLTKGNSGYNGNDINAAHVNMDIVKRIRDLLTQVSTRTGTATTAINVKTHTHMDPNPDHRAISQACMYLQYNGEIGVNCLRQYISPLTYTGSYLDQFGTTFAAASTLNPETEKPAATAKFKDALLCFVKTTDKLGGMWGLDTHEYGIGYNSVWNMFNAQITNLYSLYHTPVAPIL
jgi:LmbE family N-acetylglucosaminyl deacetylase